MVVGGAVLLLLFTFQVFQSCKPILDFNLILFIDFHTI
jgi:hypothetical protein